MNIHRHEFAAAEAKARFSELLARAEAGEEIVIKRHGKVVAKLGPVHPSPSLEERRRSIADYVDWLRREGPTLGPDLTIRQLIEEGRRY